MVQTGGQINVTVRGKTLVNCSQFVGDRSSAPQRNSQVRRFPLRACSVNTAFNDLSFMSWPGIGWEERDRTVGL